MAELSSDRDRRGGDGDTVVESPEHTLVTFDVPVEAFVLSETIDALPGVAVECASGAQCGTSPTMPLVWVRGVERAELEAALEADSSVDRAALVERVDGELLYRIDWAGSTRLRVITSMLAGDAAVIREVYGSRDGWVARVLFTSREDVSRVGELCESHNVDVSIVSIRDVRGGRGDRFGLTSTQTRALSLAYEMGYFEVPRGTDLDEVAAGLGLTHQSLSERLRRGTESLIRSTIVERRLG